MLVERRASELKCTYILIMLPCVRVRSYEWCCYLHFIMQHTQKVGPFSRGHTCRVTRLFVTSRLELLLINCLFSIHELSCGVHCCSTDYWESNYISIKTLICVIDVFGFSSRLILILVESINENQIQLKNITIYVIDMTNTTNKEIWKCNCLKTLTQPNMS
jgi:hypothetical protein